MPFKKFDVDKAIIERFGSKEEFNKVCERLDIEEKIKIRRELLIDDNKYIQDMYDE